MTTTGHPYRSPQPTATFDEATLRLCRKALQVVSSGPDHITFRVEPEHSRWAAGLGEGNGAQWIVGGFSQLVLVVFVAIDFLAAIGLETRILLGVASMVLYVVAEIWLNHKMINSPCVVTLRPESRLGELALGRDSDVRETKLLWDGQDVLCGEQRFAAIPRSVWFRSRKRRCLAALAAAVNGRKAIATEGTPDASLGADPGLLAILEPVMGPVVVRPDHLTMLGSHRRQTPEFVVLSLQPLRCLGLLCFTIEKYLFGASSLVSWCGLVVVSSLIGACVSWLSAQGNPLCAGRLLVVPRGRRCYIEETVAFSGRWLIRKAIRGTFQKPSRYWLSDDDRWQLQIDSKLFGATFDPGRAQAAARVLGSYAGLDESELSPSP